MPNPRLYKTEAIIVRQRKLGEADRILTLYTPALGKLDAKAKGVRKTTSRMSGHLQPLTRCLLQMARGHASDVITGCETLESFQPLREDLDRLSRALYAAELVDRMTAERVHSFPTYRLLLDTLRRLQQSANPDLVLRFLEMRLMDQAGFGPRLDACVGCSRPLEPEQHFFAPQAGGAVCRACVPGLAGPRVLTLNGLKVLRLLQRGSYNDVARVNVPPDLAQEVEHHLRSYIVCVLERDVNAAAFIERLRREERNTEPGTGNKEGQGAPCS
ncbi:MAG: DNA repair protein RecO [Dehalococcoidia bacterium]|nr:DNA repair protein RecO [Dehalococcoidia bacterium]